MIYYLADFDIQATIHLILEIEFKVSLQFSFWRFFILAFEPLGVHLFFQLVQTFIFQTLLLVSPLFRGKFVQKIPVFLAAGESLLISGIQGFEGVIINQLTLYFLLFRQSFLHLFFICILDSFGFSLLFLLEFRKVNNILFQNLIALFQCFLSLFGFIFQIGYLFLYYSMSHGYQEHLFFLLQDAKNRLILPNQILIFLPILNDFQSSFYHFFLFVIEIVYCYILIINIKLVFIKSFQWVPARSCCFIPNLLILYP